MDTLDKERKQGFARFRADILWALEPFVTHARNDPSMRMLDGAIFVEPCAEGGAMIIGCSGPAMAVFRDSAGVCSTPMTLDLPDALFAACAPRAPIAMNFCGDQYSVPLPEWTEAGDVYAYHAGVHLTPKMRAPGWAEEENDFQPCLFSETEHGNGHTVGQHYRWQDGIRVSWRKPLQSGIVAEAPHDIVADPAIQGLFVRSIEIATKSLGNFPAVHHRQLAGKDDAPGPILLLLTGFPDFCGTYMPQHTEARPSVPTWFEKRVSDAVRTVQ
jgi:hypothetical protein